MQYGILDSNFAGHFERCSDGAIWVEMPSNIALVKYMGKLDSSKNLATNGSYSLTLPYLKTRIRCTKVDQALDSWSLLKEPSLLSMSLSDKGQNRFLNFWSTLKQKFGIKGFFLIESGNNFPSDCGIASSSSSFAALTVAAYVVASEQKSKKVQDMSLQDLANISRLGSGSSCRSFFKSGAYWKGDQVKQVVLPIFEEAQHLVVLVESGKKTMSSSEAHRQVVKSLLFQGRIERAESRLAALMQGDLSWQEIYHLCWSEFWDMHALFETCHPPFGYMTGGTLTVLNEIRHFWLENQDGPIVTMDAGANIHVVFHRAQSTAATQFKQRLKDLGFKWQEGQL